MLKLIRLLRMSIRVCVCVCVGFIDIVLDG